MTDKAPKTNKTLLIGAGILGVAGLTLLAVAFNEASKFGQTLDDLETSLDELECAIDALDSDIIRNFPDIAAEHDLVLPTAAEQRKCDKLLSPSNP